MTGDVVLLNSCLASGACVDITVRDAVIHEIGDTEVTGGTPKSNRENAAIDPLIDFRLYEALTVKVVLFFVAWASLFR